MPDIRNNQLTIYKDNLPAFPPSEGILRYLSRVMIRMVDVKSLVHLVTLCQSKEFFKTSHIFKSD